ncbi:MAG: ATP-dependent 6-phosphofructokinase [Deltaproteobacteria bacterium]|nr:ATP-dependent 6-phosphofructokinase [Deltaproteobacteria bacterium]NIS76299.1 ATP-dependent 6-phosphofructokinase [Deltaproteobacteria bacterium]
MKIGVLTGGGDCPGLNAVIRAVIRKSDRFGYRVLGINNGWKGLLDLSYRDLLPSMASGILHVGGTILGTSRTNPLKREGGLDTVLKNVSRLELGAIIAIGGEDTLGVAKKLYDEGVNIVGVPKTIDNDLSGTDYTFGFDTAVTIATEAIDRLHSTAESHNRIMVVEVMGRNTGWIATYAGLAGGADAILIPEKPFDLDEVCELLVKRHMRGKQFSIVVVAEGAKLAVRGAEEKLITQETRVDEFGHVRLGGIAQVIATEIEKKTGFETRFVVLGHIQRGGSPTPHDRVLATRFGIFATEMVKKGEFGKMAALAGDRIVAVPLEEAVAKTKTVNMEIFKISEEFFG